MCKIELFEKNGFKLCAVVTTEASKQRVGVTIYEVNELGKMSVPVTFKRSEIMKKSSSLNLLLDFGICLTEDEFEAVIEKCINLLNSEKASINLDNRSTSDELYRGFCEYAKDTRQKEIYVTDSIKVMPKAVADREFLDIQTKEFEYVMEEIPETEGYKKIEILKVFKFMGVLQTDKGRAYDKKVALNGKKVNCYRIMMSDFIDTEENSKEKGKTEKNECGRKDKKSQC